MSLSSWLVIAAVLCLTAYGLGRLFMWGLDQWWGEQTAIDERDPEQVDQWGHT